MFGMRLNPDALGGLIISRAKDFAEAKAIANSDSFDNTGLRSYTLWRWTVNEGSDSLRVNYSDQTDRLTSGERRAEMGMLIKGKWVDDDAQYRTAASGAFVRPDSVFTHGVTADGSSGFKAEAGRYHLFLAPNCPWAHRTQIFRRLKGLENVISISLAGLPRKRSWAYSTGIGRDLEPLDGVFELHQAYISAVPDYTGRVTVPTLWDKKEWTIVNNESSEIIRMLNSEFDEWGDASVDLYPAPLRSEIDKINDRVYTTVNNGVYRCGFAKSQLAYEEAFRQLFRHAGLSGRAARTAALSVRRTDHGSRLAALRDAGAVRCRLLRQFQVQSQSHLRVSQPLELPARALPVAGHSRDHRHCRHQARLLINPIRQSERHRAARAR
jgi:hypothetical protein